MALLIRTEKSHTLQPSVISDYSHTPMSLTCTVLSEKLKALEAVLGEGPELKALEAVLGEGPELKALEAVLGEGPELAPSDAHLLLEGKTFQSREALMARANSVKKAVKGVLDVAASCK